MKPRTPPVPDASNVPAELRDPDAAVWHDDGLYREYMDERGWRLDVRAVWGVPVPVRARRRYAVEAWARQAGIVTEVYGWARPDRDALRAMGLLP